MHAMARCEITGRRDRVGNNVSHANNRTRRLFGANLQKVHVVDENGTRRRAVVSTRALKSNLVAKAAPRKVLLAQLAAEGKLPKAGAKKDAARKGAAKK
jgi:large subunit ribosomal protein L28